MRRFYFLSQAYDEGDIFPIWGECLGLELLSMLIAGRDFRKGQLDQELFSNVDAKNVGLKLILPRGRYYAIQPALGVCPDFDSNRVDSTRILLCVHYSIGLL